MNLPPIIAIVQSLITTGHYTYPESLSEDNDPGWYECLVSDACDIYDELVKEMQNRTKNEIHN